MPGALPTFIPEASFKEAMPLQNQKGAVAMAGCALALIAGLIFGTIFDDFVMLVIDILRCALILTVLAILSYVVLSVLWERLYF